MAKLKFAFPFTNPNDTEYALTTDCVNDETIKKNQAQLNDMLTLISECNDMITESGLTWNTQIVPSVYLSEAEYDALSDELKNKNIEYNIY